MFRLRYSLWLFVLVWAAPLAASDPKDAKHDDKHGGAGHAKPVYEVFVEDEDGKHVKKTFNLANPTERNAFIHTMEHHHVHEATNVTPPTIRKLASLTYDLGIWTLVIFFLFVFLAGKILWPTILAKFQAREGSIRDAIAEAHKAQSEAKDIRASLQKQLDEVHLQVKSLIDEAKKDAQATTDEMIAKAKADITTERDRLQRDIQTQTDQALQSLWTRAAELATQLSATALGQQIDMPTHRKLIDKALSDIRTRETSRHA